MPVALITGCSSGIGMHTALTFARKGITTYASIRNTSKVPEPLAPAQGGSASDDGAPVEVVRLDVRDSASIIHVVRTIEERHGAIDVLVNNAGVWHADPLETVATELAEEVMDTNFWGAVRTIRAVLPGMREHGGGAIVNVGSAGGRVPGMPYSSFYGASKHALSALSESLAFEVKPFGIHVACVEPAQVPTKLFSKHPPEQAARLGPYAADRAWAERYFQESKRDASCPAPSEVADAVLQAALNPRCPLHVLVGENTKTAVEAAQRCGTFEEWSQVAVQAMEATAGPRPPRRQSDPAALGGQQ
ncbi:SDR family oxidoreductase [Streptomyces sp. DB-54]